MPIWKQAQLRRYGHARLMAAEGGDDGSTGSGGGDGTDDVQARIDAAVSAAVAGLKTKNGELLGKLKERDEALKRFDGIDPDAVRNILRRFSDDEEAKLIADGKIDDVLNKRTERMKVDFEKKYGEATAAAEAAERRAQAFQGRVLDDAIRAAAAKAGLHQHAIEDALFRARSMFTLDEDGQAVMLGEDKRPVLGKDGKSPFAPLEWLEGMKEKAPHWFPASASGSGAGGSSGAGKPEVKDLAHAKTREERVAVISARLAASKT